MSIDIFGRSLKNGVGVSGPPGPRGQGFKITTDGQYDIESRRLCNVDNPISVNDAATVQFVQKELSVMYNSFMTEQSEVISHLHSQVFAWTVPIKRKTGVEVTSAMKSVLEQGRVPKNLHVDQGKEFYNTEFKKLMKRHDINLYSTYSNMKASIVERFNRTLKTKMWREFSARGSYKWIDMLAELVNTYNNTKHRTIKMKPIDVTKAQEWSLLENIYMPMKSQSSKRKKNRFKVGDVVRISRYKHVFEKGYTPNWTTELFTVTKVRNTDPVTYELEDWIGIPIKGGFYNEELSKAKYSDIFLVEKVLKKRGNKLYVKWLGFDSKHNSWIDETDM
ncbi:uncharacterized protein LOC123275250 [Cotesia glomerata]|uniref:uncharacterized protein LOC123275250 n=1 Tax=Cotesia glomerata TaxID=32391 RepID=UPI001D00FE88|nr:uncharacterized protein LOC123275250 [Cotesia glomerata]